MNIHVRIADIHRFPLIYAKFFHKRKQGVGRGFFTNTTRFVFPNGIVEHQIVFEGTNTVAHRSYGYLYSATNLAYTLQRDESPQSTKRMVVGSDVDRAVTDPTAREAARTTT